MSSSALHSRILRSLIVICAVCAFTPAQADVGDGCLFVVIIDLNEGREDALRDSLVEDLLGAGCWLDSRREGESYNYILSRDLPRGVTVDLVRKAAGGNRSALARIQKRIQQGAHHSTRRVPSWWRPHGFLLYERLNGGRTVRLTGLAATSPRRNSPDPYRTVTYAASMKSVPARVRASLLERALRPLRQYFPP